MTDKSLREVRKKMKAKMVIWILPSYTLKPYQRKIINSIASEYGDKMIDITLYVGYDGYHPSDYKPVADITRNIK
jgi:hypothetical protein